jgi:hypothetical protein
MLQRHEIDCDVLVAGGGMAGVCAAIAAARAGSKVVLIQDRSVLGGNASSEVRMHIVGADCHGGRKGCRESGLIEELRLEDAVRNPERCYPFWDVLLYEKVIAEPNITLLLDTDVVGAEVTYEKNEKPNLEQRPPRTGKMYEYNGSKGKITAAIAVRHLTEDEFIIRAKMYADCTGDGRLGFEAGADFRIGRESVEMHNEKLAQPTDDIYTLGSSILITSRKLDKPAPFIAPPWVRKFSPELLKVGRGIRSWEYGFWWIEWGGQIDSIKDGATTIRHELYAISLGVWDYVKNSGLFPESANWTLDWIGAIPGKRESRRFVGPHMLTEQDVLDPKPHGDEVAFGGWAIDLHPYKGIDAIDEPPFTPTHGKTTYGIPLRCLFSRNIENLFFAGRNISATHVAFASTRVMATCAVNGEAIGWAMGQCVKQNTTPAALVADKAKIAELQRTMLKNDVTILNAATFTSKASEAKVSASSEVAGSPAANVLNGKRRDDIDMKSGEILASHQWKSQPLNGGSASIELAWNAAVDVSEIHLTFDTNFGRELTLSANDHTNGKVIRSAQPETVKDYAILIDGKEVAKVAGNYSRKRVHKLDKPVSGKTLKLVVSATNGAPEARVFEIGVF